MGRRNKSVHGYVHKSQTGSLGGGHSDQHTRDFGEDFMKVLQEDNRNISVLC